MISHIAHVILMAMSLFALASVAPSRNSVAAEPQDSIFGTWLREEHDRHIHIGPCGEETGPICGRIVALIDPSTGRPLTDQNAVGKTGIKLIGTAVLIGCRPDGSGLKCARSYIPTTDASYSNINVTLERDGRLSVGRVSRYFYWTRVN